MDQQIHAQTRGETVNVPRVVYTPDPCPLDTQPAPMWIRVYDVCAEGAHTDPELQRQGYAEGGI